MNKFLASLLSKLLISLIGKAINWFLDYLDEQHRVARDKKREEILKKVKEAQTNEDRKKALEELDSFEFNRM